MNHYIMNVGMQTKQSVIVHIVCSAESMNGVTVQRAVIELNKEKITIETDNMLPYVNKNVCDFDGLFHQTFTNVLLT